ncbi:carbamate kinase [Desulfosarcina widdelii]|uniref:Carbamate kinase n=1 Tax=Desulfosarcina widdelii TaxID=947919 RepID=A0A5K7ZDC7_9BACT|nr:carbamate kinase [Desulfosarcina widdelii]BBO78820.1 carbamate kinase [Desulfosarcina widdelii]
MPNKPILLIAFGGNALIKKGQSGTASQQLSNLTAPLEQLAKLSRDYRIVITHGNGPQVGNLLLQQEACSEVPTMPLEIIGAMTQGQIGYMIESTLDTSLMFLGIEDKRFVTLITYVVVDDNDPGFANPTKPIGPFYSPEDADKVPYTLKMTDKGLRRVVASPRPKTIVERHEIKQLVDMDFIVICCGGGGIPVIRHGRKFTGVEAVIDKDLASSVLASEIRADLFVIATDVSGAYIDWGKDGQALLKSLSVEELREYSRQGQFPSGSMDPKVRAIAEFVEKTGNRGVICNLDDITEAIAGRSGTQVTRA